ncbi:hypothetical protein [Novosphingobium album (ex Liu et al. 2023)]|uniref:Uncharacterized protein n=1 Tax=Novosphingobium album (ex Liu et al. 2023) TaxID=3031130 RepID=A0ABT5WTF2_9SPHN|nr:hypothetical protein [Novosphingobium album (ex Liu et al. 2023)]MDE8652993.1 hypothetical protein [Novosphingobium album (ex Liu et al. 2023)]
MDLNQLLHHHQVALMRDAGLSFLPALGSSFDIVSHYARRITKLRDDMGVPQYPAWVRADALASGPVPG